MNTTKLDDMKSTRDEKYEKFSFGIMLKNDECELIKSSLFTSPTDGNQHNTVIIRIPIDRQQRQSMLETFEKLVQVLRGDFLLETLCSEADDCHGSGSQP